MPALTLPFAHLNLRRNPFGELDRSARAALTIADTDGFVARLRRPGAALQFLGGRGLGKTTHLLTIAARIRDAKYLEVTDHSAADLPDGPVLLVDEAQFLSRRDRRRLFARRAPFAIGTHCDFSSERPMETVRLALPAPERLACMLERRIEWERRGPGPVPRVGAVAVYRLLARHADVRAIERHLYEIFQDLGGPVDVEV